ncbi:MAG TPA: hypothetical protein VGK94_07940 [Candidatus Polarisedimenticolia bacterium]
MPYRSGNKAFEALVARVKTIQGSGSGHFTSLAGRVYTRHWLPENAKSDLPYVCLPIVSAAGQPDTDEGNMIRDVWEATLICYVPETSTEEPTCTAIGDALNLKDDIFDVLMKDWTLDGQVESCKVTSWDITGGEPPTAGYARLIVRVKMHQYLDDEYFGP